MRERTVVVVNGGHHKTKKREREEVNAMQGIFQKKQREKLFYGKDEHFCVIKANFLVSLNQNDFAHSEE
jgi:hypothetical protein